MKEILVKVYPFLVRHYFTIFMTFIIFFLILFISKKILNRLNRKSIYVGCLYSQTGVLGRDPYHNYDMLVKSFEYSIKKYKCNLEIIPIYTDLGDNLDNFSIWVEKCVKKYNMKYFFGCWRSSERKQVIPILKKYNLRLFYPLQYEGFECSKNIYYLGASPNQQIIPSIKFMFDTYYYYQDVYVIGSSYIYSEISLLLIKKFIEDKNNINKYNNKKLVYYKLYPFDTTDFSEFIVTLFKKSPKGAIIFNLINGKSYFEFSKQLSESYQTNFPNIDKKILSNNQQLLNILDKPINNIVHITNQYPSISFSITENSIPKEYLKYLIGNFYSWNFVNEILVDPVYQIYDGDESQNMDLEFLQKYNIKSNELISDPQYCSFLSAQFFVKTCKELMDAGLDIYNPDNYDNHKKQTITSVSGEHYMNSNNHISKNYLVLFLGDSGKYNIQYQNIVTIDPDPFMGMTDKLFSCNAQDETLQISDRLYLE